MIGDTRPACGPDDSDDDPDFDAAQESESSTDEENAENTSRVRRHETASLLTLEVDLVAAFTPHPQAQPHGSRKRKWNPKIWKKVRRSMEYNQGHQSKNGVKSGRKVGARCGCKLNRCMSVSDGDRVTILDQFWGKDDGSSTPDSRHSFILA